LAWFVCLLLSLSMLLLLCVGGSVLLRMRWTLPALVDVAVKVKGEQTKEGAGLVAMVCTLAMAQQTLAAGGGHRFLQELNPLLEQALPLAHLLYMYARWNEMKSVQQGGRAHVLTTHMYILE
jgi:hypothetical protein